MDYACSVFPGEHANLHRTCDHTCWVDAAVRTYVHGTYRILLLRFGSSKADCLALQNSTTEPEYRLSLFIGLRHFSTALGTLANIQKSNVNSIMASEKGQYQPLRDQSWFSDDDNALQGHDGLSPSRPWHRQIPVSKMVLSTFCVLLLAVSSVQFWLILKLERRLIHPHS